MELSLKEIARYIAGGIDACDEKINRRILELAASAPITPRSVWAKDGGRFLICATIGPEFDAWHRRLAVMSAADTILAQAIGTAAVEKVIDGIEDEIRSSLSPGEELKKRWSPGYGDKPLSMSREILDKLDARRKIGVSLTGSFLLVPSKSVTAVLEEKQ